MIQWPKLIGEKIMSFIVKNSKGMFAGYSSYALVSQHGFQVMKEVFADSNHPVMLKMSKGQKAKLEEAFSLMEHLPVANHYMYFMKNDCPNLVKKPTQPYYSWDHGYGTGGIDCLEIVGLHSFSSSSGITNKKQDGMSSHAFLEKIEEQLKIANFVAALSSFAKHCDVSLIETPLKNLKKINKAILDGEYDIKDIDMVTEMGEVEASVVFISGWGENGGYLNYKGGISPLAGARLFESEGAAKRTISSQRLRNAIVVKVKTQIMEVQCEIGQNDTKRTQNLREAIARVEKKNILKALETASVEQIKAKLDEYEKQDPNKNVPMSSKKRAM